MSDNKLEKMIMDAATLTGLGIGIGWIAEKVVEKRSIILLHFSKRSCLGQ